MRGSYQWNPKPRKESVLVNKFDQRGIKKGKRFKCDGRPPRRSWTAMELLHRYKMSLNMTPEKLDDNNPAYQPEAILIHNESLSYNQEVFQCNHCSTIVTWHPKTNLEDCPFCNRSLRNNVTILRHAPLKDLLLDREVTLGATF